MAPDCWKPWTSDHVAAGASFFQKIDCHIFGSLERLTTLPQAFFQMAPCFWKPWMPDYVAAGALFSPENWPPYFGKPHTADYVAVSVFVFSPEKMPVECWRDSQVDLDLDVSSL